MKDIKFSFFYDAAARLRGNHLFLPRLFYDSACLYRKSLNPAGVN